MKLSTKISMYAKRHAFWIMSMVSLGVMARDELSGGGGCMDTFSA